MLSHHKLASNVDICGPPGRRYTLARKCAHRISILVLGPAAVLAGASSVRARTPRVATGSLECALYAHV